MPMGQQQAYPHNVDVEWIRAPEGAETEPASSVEARYRERATSHCMHVHPTADYPFVERQLRVHFGLEGLPVEFHHRGIIPLGAFAGPPKPPPPRKG